MSKQIIILFSIALGLQSYQLAIKFQQFQVRFVMAARLAVYIEIWQASQVLQIYSLPSGNLPGLKCQISWNLPPAMKSQLCQPKYLENLKPYLAVVSRYIIKQNSNNKRPLHSKNES
ncbi:Hypothetical_protein [Hexamita inflata]|uniref:Hypothetical_protein n=1 Tax=Hexamita inflata TaxID=28002 RepID=A0AA86QQE6_9EUKA|nr:Hypothetical protein HINF_LOCUS47456 [Hexamita inflata]